MTITYNDKTYDVRLDSIYCDFQIDAFSVEHACGILTSFDGMSEYVFNLDTYKNMVITKRSIVVTDSDIIVRVRLREKTQGELAQEELDSLRKAMSDLAETTNKTTTAKINKILNNDEGVK